MATAGRPIPARRSRPCRPAGFATAPPAGEAAPAGDPDALRLISRRTLWDNGTQVQAVPALAGLHPETRVTVHPMVMAAMGLADGEAVRVRSTRGSLVLPAAGDPDLPARSALLLWNLPGSRRRSD